MWQGRIGWRTLLSGRMRIVALMGFASGLPYLLTLTVLQAWLTAGNVDLTTIGFLAIVALPYNLKFLWAPLVDHFVPLRLGRRRGWLVLTQCALAASLTLLGLQSPQMGLANIAVAATLVAFFSATQDTVIDAYRRESLSELEQGVGASMYVYGYRFGTLVASAGGLILADWIGFRGVYLVMAVTMLAMSIVTLLAPEPDAHPDRPRTLRAAFVDPFVEFVSRYKSLTTTVALLTLVLVYNLGIHLSGHMVIPYLLWVGFSNGTIGTVLAVFGFAPFLLGVLAGGVLQSRIGLRDALILISVLKSLTIAALTLLAFVGDNIWWLAAIMTFQNLAVGMGSVGLMTFIAQLTNQRFTATQFAVLTAFAALPRATLTAPTGWLATVIGWSPFFLFCAAMAIPGLLLLIVFRNLVSDGGYRSASGHGSRG